MYAAPLAAARKGGTFYSDIPVLKSTGTYRRTGLGRREEMTVEEPIVFEVGARGSGLFVYVLAKYITDGFSFPGLLLQLFQPRNPLGLLAAILHDWLYDTGLVPRAIADRILLNAMRAGGVPRPLRLIVYWGVRVGGGPGFNKPHTKNADVIAAARKLDVRAAVLAYLAAQQGEAYV